MPTITTPTIKTPTIKAVVFDLDDTLYPERAYAFSGFAAVAESLADLLGDPSAVAGELEALFDTPHRPRVFNALLEQHGLPDDPQRIQELVTIYRRHIPTLSLFADADRALDRVRLKFKLGIITDGLMITQSLKIKALQLADRVDKIIITSELGPQYGKPHPKAFEWMASALGMAPEQCVYVGDNLTKDFLAPNRLGWRTIRIIREHGIYADARATEGGTPHHTIHSLDDLDPLLE
ncbi:MAG: HAD family hydrolase [Phycisphaerae bacterium]